MIKGAGGVYVEIRKQSEGVLGTKMLRLGYKSLQTLKLRLTLLLFNLSLSRAAEDFRASSLCEVIDFDEENVCLC
ncbi:hypothetical protein RJT34_09484 [Clitoria ternatea]|uniref:Uncharacterized protein n=1 Tax=Clitoria ternatea TaxID=43366 RepID=A0AAN9PTB2_CLITE